uniref:HlyD family efflux transporter periplasmic adaptor subunit n=1 Tax=Mesorhizobium atlanticum TaxID=2233532 RepID=UPI003704A0B6
MSGRVEYRLAQAGEVVAAGGRVLTLLDLSDAHMTIFLPTSQVGRVESSDRRRGSCSTGRPDTSSRQRFPSSQRMRSSPQNMSRPSMSARS